MTVQAAMTVDSFYVELCMHSIAIANSCALYCHSSIYCRFVLKLSLQWLLELIYVLFYELFSLDFFYKYILHLLSIKKLQYFYANINFAKKLVSIRLFSYREGSLETFAQIYLEITHFIQIPLTNGILALLNLIHHFFGSLFVSQTNEFAANASECNAQIEKGIQCATEAVEPDTIAIDLTLNVDEFCLYGKVKYTYLLSI